LAEEEIRWSPVMAVQLGAGVGTQNGLGLKGPAMVEGQTLFQLAFANSDGGLGRFHTLQLQRVTAGCVMQDGTARWSFVIVYGFSRGDMAPVVTIRKVMHVSCGRQMVLQGFCAGLPTCHW